MKLTRESILEFDESLMSCNVNTIEKNGALVESTVLSICGKYCSDLDSLVSQSRILLSSNSRLEDFEIENLVAQIPLCLYFLSDFKESVAIREDTAKMIRQSLYSDARIHATGTAADKDTVAEQAVESETLTRIAYSHARQLLQGKIEMGLEILSALKKVLSSRTESYFISQRDGGLKHGSDI